LNVILLESLNVYITEQMSHVQYIYVIWDIVCHKIQLKSLRSVVIKPWAECFWKWGLIPDRSYSFIFSSRCPWGQPSLLSSG